MENKRYLKVMFGTTSGANSSLTYKIGKVNVTNHWNPNSLNPEEMGGFNFSVEDKILRWLVRGDTIYDVTIPDDAEIIDCPSESAPHEVFRTNKIILSNPRKVTDEMALDFYRKSDLPEKSYFKAMAGCAVRGYINTALEIFHDKVNTSNIGVALDEFMDFCKPQDGKTFSDEYLEGHTKKIYQLLLEVRDK